MGKIKEHKENPRIILNLHSTLSSEHKGRAFNLKFSTIEDMNVFLCKLCVSSGKLESISRVQIDKQNGIDTFAPVPSQGQHANKRTEHEEHKTADEDPTAKTPTGRISISAASVTAASREKDHESS